MDRSQSSRRWHISGNIFWTLQIRRRSKKYILVDILNNLFPHESQNLIRRSLNSAPRNKPHHPNQFVDLFCRLGRVFLILLHIEGDYVTGSLPPSQISKKQVVSLGKVTRAPIVYYDAKVTLLCTLCTLENKMRTKRLFFTLQRSALFFNSLILPQSPTPNPSSF